jgi:hypothetical protein
MHMFLFVERERAYARTHMLQLIMFDINMYTNVARWGFDIDVIDISV